MKHGNLFQPLPDDQSREFSEILATGSGSLRIERIVSDGHATPVNEWYDQDTTEWVLLLSGSAILRFEDDPSPRHLQPGDWLEIIPHRRHRVEATSSAQKSVWLAVHWT